MYGIRVLTPAIASLALLLSICRINAQPTKETARANARQSLRVFLQSVDDNKQTRYLAAFTDLNGDGKPEAIVYLISPQWCGSGGCSMFVLEQNGTHWKAITRTAVTQLPIRILGRRSHGWHSLGVWVQGGGMPRGYEAELQFNGRSYPTNPTVLPARRVEKQPQGEILISSSQKPLALYNDTTPRSTK